LENTQKEGADNEPEHEPLKGGKDKEKNRMTAQTTTGMKSGWQHGTAHPFRNAADDPLESTNPSVTCKKREGPNTQ
jgi:hypothetical protein